MPRGQLTRREFLIIGGTVAAGTMAAGPVAALPSRQGVVPQPRIIFRLSLRGRRGSKAAKMYNANLRFATQGVADQNRVNAFDNSRIVELIVSDDEFDRLFTSRDSEIADLRVLGGPVRVGDCNRNKKVTIDELIRGVNIALGNAPVSECLPFDRVADGQIKIDELVRGVRNALG